MPLRDFRSSAACPPDIIRHTNANNHRENAWVKFERAEVDIDAFDELFAAESPAPGVQVRGKDVPAAVGRGDLRPEMVEALRHTAARFKTGCITNNLPANGGGSDRRILRIRQYHQPRGRATTCISGWCPGGNP